MRGEPVAGVEVEPVGVGSVRAETGVEVELVAAEAAGLGEAPVEEGSAGSLAAGGGEGSEVVDVEDVAPGEVMEDSEAGEGDDAIVSVGDGEKGCDEAVALRALDGVDALGERLGRLERRPQLARRLEGEVGLALEELAEVHARR
jgi:hypothetical protein